MKRLDLVWGRGRRDFLKEDPDYGRLCLQSGHGLRHGRLFVFYGATIPTAMPQSSALADFS